MYLLNSLIENIDNFFSYLNNNKMVLIFVIILLSIYAVYLNEYVVDLTINLFEKKEFRLVIFIIITYISSQSPAIGIILVIIMLTSMQIITNIKFKKELEH
jgi:hypothetical protein